MAFKIKSGRFVARMYYGELKQPHGNVMAFFYRDEAEEANLWKFHYRFRYYLDDKVYQSTDRRSQDFVLTINGTFDEILPKIHHILKVMTTVAGSPFPDEVVVNSDDPEKVGQTLLGQPWAHQEDPLSRMNPNPVGIA